MYVSRLSLRSPSGRKGIAQQTVVLGYPSSSGGPPCGRAKVAMPFRNSDVATSFGYSGGHIRNSPIGRDRIMERRGVARHPAMSASVLLIALGGEAAT